MFCKNCGNKIETNSIFCANCGSKIESIKKEKKSNAKLIILIMLIIITILLSICAFIVFKNNNKNDTRTIMIYMAGSNLESDAGIATSDLNSILPDKINLEKTNVLLYTGSTKIWHNFASSNENAIYILKKDGFEKLESYNEKSLGDSEIFKSFLNYSYTNYKADEYNLIFWNHGLGALGSISDEKSNDFLTLLEMEEALKNSYFNKNNKLNTVLFRTCLNATYEMASVFSNYANYMIASEEVTIGRTNESVLNFINELSPTDNGEEYGKKFIKAYQQQVNNIDTYSSIDSTYSIIDLTKFQKLNQQINSFFSKIDAKENYNAIAKVRSNLHQYAVKTSNNEAYDTVDLYELINNLKSYSSKDAYEILNTINEMVLYNWSTNDSSHGIAIYFPFNGQKKIKDIHLDIYSKINALQNYYDFIKKFNSVQTDGITFDFSLSKNEVKMKNKEFSLKLTEEQVKNYAGAYYIVFKKTEDNYFIPLYSSQNTKIDKNGVISTNVSNNLIKVVDKSDNSEAYIQAYETSSKNKEYITSIMLSKFDKELVMKSANMHLKINKNGKPIVTNTTLIDNNTNVGSASVNYEDYTTVQFGNFKYKILDENGNYIENWEGTATQNLYELKTKDNNIEFKTASLDDDKDYYCVFKIKDVKNNYYYSNLIRVN